MIVAYTLNRNHQFIQTHHQANFCFHNIMIEMQKYFPRFILKPKMDKNEQNMNFLPLQGKGRYCHANILY